MRFALLAALLALPARSFAWGPAGHRAVAAIAESRLDPQAAAQVKALLPPGVRLADIANCADVMIYEPQRCAGAFDLPRRQDTASWHFVSIPLSAPTDASLDEYCPGDCILRALPRQLAILRDPNASAEDRRLALVEVVHLVGDVHQPLHAADDSDWGGNKKNVEFEGLAANLHKVWDSLVTDEHLKDELVRFAPGSSPRADGWMWRESAAGARFTDRVMRANLGRELRTGVSPEETMREAARESHALAVEIYADFFRNGGAIGPDYEARMRPVAEERIAVAGLRLAEALNDALGRGAQRRASDRMAFAAVNGRLAPLLSDPWSPR